MSDNRWEVYNNVCKDQFQKMEDKMGKVEDKVDALTAIVTNGLTDRVKKIERWNWFIITGIITLLATAIYGLIR